MDSKMFALVAGALVASVRVCAVAAEENVVTVHTDDVVCEASDDLWGLFLEDVNLSIDGGIYAEMVRNRSFEDGNGAIRQLTLEYWNTIGNAEYLLSEKQGAHLNDLHCVTVRGRAGSGLVNEGYFGMGVKEGESYNLSVALRGDFAFADVSLEAYGKPVVAKARIDGITSEWKTFNVSFVAQDTDPRCCLAFRFYPSDTRDNTIHEVQMDHVSLFPANAVCGLFRRDLIERLSALHPSFMRFPGGCWVEGDEMRLAYRWKKTIGDKWNRRTQWNRWKYWATNGVGFHEYLLLCEVIGAKPLYCINCGMSHSDNVPLEKMDEFVQDALDCIEYANGPTDSKWGAVRAAAGHPEPFNLEYLEIGNENGGPDYEARYPLIAKAVRTKYPEIKLVFNRWASTEDISDGPRDLRDDHFYNSADIFMSRHAHDYDEKKGDFGIFVGEYAVTTGAGRYGNLRAAIGEAAVMLGFERNQNQVKLAAYAPLFANAQHTVWTPNLIYPTTDGCFVNPSWNVQRLFSANRGVQVLKLEVATSTFRTKSPKKKGGGFDKNNIEKVQGSAVRAANGDVIVKLVNCSEEKQPVMIKGVSGNAVKTVFTGPNREAHNLPGEPELVKETTSSMVLDGQDVLPPLSLVVYRVPTVSR